MKHYFIILLFFATSWAHAQIWQKAKENCSFPTVKVLQSAKFIYNLSSLKDAVYLERSDNFGHHWKEFKKISETETGSAISLDLQIKDTFIYVLCQIRPKTLSMLVFGESGKQMEDLQLHENITANPKTDHLFFIQDALWLSCEKGLFKYDFKKKVFVNMHSDACKDLWIFKNKLYKISVEGNRVFTSSDEGKSWKNISVGLEENTELLELLNFRKSPAIIGSKGLWIWKAEKWEKQKDLPFIPLKTAIYGNTIFLFGNDLNRLPEIAVYPDWGTKNMNIISVPQGFAMQNLLYYQESIVAMLDWICYRVKYPLRK